MKEESVIAYFNSLLSNPRINTYINKCRKERGDARVFSPRLTIRPSIRADVAGITYSENFIQISSWILADTIEAKVVVRHELAHALHMYSKLGGRDHGKEYNSVLKIVSPRTWRGDKHWYPTPFVEEARRKYHKTNRTPMVRR